MRQVERCHMDVCPSTRWSRRQMLNLSFIDAANIAQARDMSKEFASTRNFPGLAVTLKKKCGVYRARAPILPKARWGKDLGRRPFQL